MRRLLLIIIALTFVSLPLAAQDGGEDLGAIETDVVQNEDGTVTVTETDMSQGVQAITEYPSLEDAQAAGYSLTSSTPTSSAGADAGAGASSGGGATASCGNIMLGSYGDTEPEGEAVGAAGVDEGAYDDAYMADDAYYDESQAADGGAGAEGGTDADAAGGADAGAGGGDEYIEADCEDVPDADGVFHCYVGGDTYTCICCDAAMQPIPFSPGCGGNEPCCE